MTLRMLTLVVVWIALFRRVTPGVVASGVLAALVATWLVPDRRTTGLRLVPFARLVWREVVQVGRATVRVATIVVQPERRAPGMVRVDLPGATDRELAWVAALTTLTPGTFVVDTTRPAGLDVHALDASDPEAVRRDVRVLHADVTAALRPAGAGNRGSADREVAA